MEGHGSQPQNETDDAFFAKQREHQDPEAERLEKLGDIEDAEKDLRGTDAARNLGGGKGDFRQAHDAGAENRQEW